MSANERGIISLPFSVIKELTSYPAEKCQFIQCVLRSYENNLIESLDILYLLIRTAPEAMAKALVEGEKNIAHLAAETGDDAALRIMNEFDVTKKLLTSKDSRGRGPIYYAQRNENFHTVNLLRELTA